MRYQATGFKLQASGFSRQTVYLVQHSTVVLGRRIAGHDWMRDNSASNHRTVD